MDWIGHSFAAAPQLSPQGRRGDYRGSQQSIHYVVAASQGRRAPRVTRRPRLLVRLRSTPCGGPQSVRNPPISTTYGEEVPRHREDDRRRCPEAAPSGSSAKCCQKAASGVTLLGWVTTRQRTAVSGGSPTSWVTPRSPPLAVLHAPPSHPSFLRSSGRTRSWRAISCGFAGDSELAATPEVAIEQAGGARSGYVLLRSPNAPRLRQPIGVTLPPLISPHS